jgi:tetratricopeptide (TPR) repeat protein
MEPAQELVHRGEALCKERRCAEASALFEEAGAADPGNAAARLFFGLCLASRRKPAEALKAFQAGAALLPIYSETAVLEFLSTPLLLYNWLRPALDSYLSTMELQQDSTGKQRTFGWILCALEEHPKALAAFDEALRADPGDVGAFYLRGKTKIALGDPSGSIPDFTRCIELRPETARAFALRGIALLGLPKPKEAVQDFRKAIELDVSLKPWLDDCALRFVEMVTKKEGAP